MRICQSPGEGWVEREKKSKLLREGREGGGGGGKGEDKRRVFANISDASFAHAVRTERGLNSEVQMFDFVEFETLTVECLSSKPTV